MSDQITSVDEVTPEWLTETLRRVGVLESGQVSAIESDVSNPFITVVARLSLVYSDDAPKSAPRHLFLKVSDPESHRQWPGRGKQEVEFYKLIPQSDYVRLGLPRCYAAAWSEAGYYLLMDDLAETHFALTHPLPPNTAQCEQIADSLARIHAYWWDDSRLGVSVGRSPEQKTIFNGNEDHFPAFLDTVGEALWDERRRIFERVLAAGDRLYERLGKGNLSLIHGDVHAWNFLYPRSMDGRAALIDWDSWDTDIALYDLAYLITLFWFPAHRARAEQPLIRLYHQRLTAYGVKGYSWDDCWYDYRHSIIRLLFRPVASWFNNRESDFWPELWWPRLERVLCAFDDLHCEELLI